MTADNAGRGVMAALMTSDDIPGIRALAGQPLRICKCAHAEQVHVTRGDQRPCTAGPYGRPCPCHDFLERRR